MGEIKKSKFRGKHLVLDDPLINYINDIKDTEVLTQEMEKNLAQRMSEGDEKAREELIRANLKFVIKIARIYKDRGVPLADLINEGNIGLIKACDNFDHTKGNHFITYAVWWIKQAISAALADQTRLIRLPMNKVNLYNKLNAIKEENGLSSIREIKGKNIMDEQMLEKDLYNIIRATKTYVPLDSLLTPDNEKLNWENTLGDGKNKKPDESLMERELKSNINTILQELSDIERTVIKHRFGLDGYQKLSLRELGNKLNLTKERIRQIERKAIASLKSNYHTNRLKAYLKC